MILDCPLKICSPVFNHGSHNMKWYNAIDFMQQLCSKLSILCNINGFICMEVIFFFSFITFPEKKSLKQQIIQLLIFFENLIQGYECYAIIQKEYTEEICF